MGFGGYKLPLPPRQPGGHSQKDLGQATTMADLQRQIDRQSLMIQTLCRLLIAKNIVQEEELDQWMQYVDSLDGHVDGKLRPAKSPRICDSCNRANPYNAAKCQYCGTEFKAEFLTPIKEKEQP